MWEGNPLIHVNTRTTKIRSVLSNPMLPDILNFFDFILKYMDGVYSTTDLG